MIVASGIVCLALNIYHEARGEPLAGKLAVAEVVINRVASPEFPDNVCDVVKQGKYRNGKPVKNQCQFSWWCDGKSDVPKNQLHWEEAMYLATTVANYQHVDITEGALYYHATHIKPYWAKEYTETVTINNHIFIDEVYMRHREPEVSTEYYNTEYKGIEYLVTYELATHCIRPGNYSSVAADPDEYYGEYSYELMDIVSIEAYDVKTEETWELDDIPAWIEEEVEREVDSYN